MEQDKNKSPDDFFEEAETDLSEVEESESLKRAEQVSSELEKSRHRISKLEILINITKSLNSTLNLNELLARIIDSIIKLADTDRGFLMLADREGEMVFRIARDKDEGRLEKDDFEVSTSIIQAVAENGKPLFIPDMMENDQFRNKESVIDLKLRTAICVPLISNEKIIGVIYTDASRLSGEITEDNISLVSAFASQAAIAIENARLHGELVLSRQNLEKENRELKQELSERYEFSGIIGKSKPMQSIFNTISKIASFDTTVLIAGETGTGKELIAKAIHYNSERKDSSLVTINCGAMPNDLLESELFGHRKGAFTGATSDKAGLFETADGGTLFLDEIGDMPQPLQIKLLRTLQEGEIRRVGENISRSVDVRIIAATNRDLSRDVESGSFRRDLYYRLNVIPISIPPLRKRREDILPLAQHFLKKYSSSMGKENISISPKAVELLISFNWPGNVRELENLIERAMAMSGASTILKEDHFPQLQSYASSREGADLIGSLKKRTKAFEKKIIEETLAETGGQVTKAAKLLDISRQHLHNKINEYRIEN